MVFLAHSWPDGLASIGLSLFPFGHISDQKCSCIQGTPTSRSRQNPAQMNSLRLARISEKDPRQTNIKAAR
jgi:hypothetical protein